MQVKEIQSILPLAEIRELNPQARYLLTIGENIPPQKCHELMHWLRAQGINCVVLPAKDVRVFEMPQ